MYVTLVGGGKLGYHLTKALLKEGYEVLLMEKDKNRWNFLEQELGEAVILGDGCELRVLEEVGCARVDVVVADSGTRIVHDLIRQRINWDRVLPLALLKEGGLEIAQITVSRYSPVMENEVLIPTGTVSLEAGDTIIALIPQDQLENLQDLFSPKEEQRWAW